MEGSYGSDRKITAEQFIDLLKRSSFDQRRPVSDPQRIQQMLEHGNVLVKAWMGEKPVGISHGLSAFFFCGYLSDLAVDKACQHQGIGKKLVKLTHEVSGSNTMLILLAAPADVNYYPNRYGTI
jgi:ribosomal protein S18 acetylase RimI-like enzyme